MNFLLLMYVLLPIIFDVVCSVSGAFEISDLWDSVVKLNTKVDDQIKRLAVFKKDLDRPTPAFMALMSKDPLTVSAKTKIVFPAVKLNVNGNYDATTGVFTAPVSGTYHFALTLSNIDSSIPAYTVDIVTGNGDRKLHSVAYVGKEVIQMRTITTLVALHANENVWIRSGNSRVKLAPGKRSFFSGFLVQRV